MARPKTKQWRDDEGWIAERKLSKNCISKLCKILSISSEHSLIKTIEKSYGLYREILDNESSQPKARDVKAALLSFLKCEQPSAVFKRMDDKTREILVLKTLEVVTRRRKEKLSELDVRKVLANDRGLRKRVILGCLSDIKRGRPAMLCRSVLAAQVVQSLRKNGYRPTSYVNGIYVKILSAILEEARENLSESARTDLAKVGLSSRY